MGRRPSSGSPGLLEAALAAPGIGGPSLSSSYIGMFIVFVYMWLPFMILPMAAALERVPGSLLQASADLGARPAQTFRNVVLPLAVPGIAAGSVFTFSLTLGDYIIPSVVGAPGYFIGMMVYVQQGTAGNIPLAAAFSVVPIVLIFVYLSIAKTIRGIRCAMNARTDRTALVARCASARSPGSRSCTSRCSSSSSTRSRPRTAPTSSRRPGSRCTGSKSRSRARTSGSRLSLSLGVAACATVIALVLGTLAAFALARAKFPGEGFAHGAVRVAHRAARHHHRHRACSPP